MRIAFLTSRVPFPPTSGDRVRAYYLLRHLTRKHEVTLYAIGRSHRAQHREAGYEEHVFSIPYWRFLWNACAGFVNKNPLQVRLYEHPQLIRRLQSDFVAGVWTSFSYTF